MNTSLTQYTVQSLEWQCCLNLYYCRIVDLSQIKWKENICTKLLPIPQLQIRFCLIFIKPSVLSTLPWNDRVHDGAGPLYCGGCAYRRESPLLCNASQPSAAQRIILRGPKRSKKGPKMEKHKQESLILYWYSWPENETKNAHRILKHIHRILKQAHRIQKCTGGKVPFYATTPSQPSAAQTLKMLWRMLRTMLQRLFLKSKFVKVSVEL